MITSYFGKLGVSASTDLFNETLHEVTNFLAVYSLIWSISKYHPYHHLKYIMNLFKDIEKS